MKKLLCWSDHADVGTGYGIVSKHILRSLHKTGKYEIHHLAINYHGDFVDSEKVPWQVSPAKLSDPKDPHGTKMFLKILSSGKYDFVWIMNDVYVVDPIASHIENIRKQLVNIKRNPVMFFSYPVDCWLRPGSGSSLKVVDVPVCWNNYSWEKTIERIPEIKNKLKIISLGVDPKEFYPLSVHEQKLHKQARLKVSKDTPVVVQVNRNSMRKQITYSLLAFKEFKKYYPNAVYYIHSQAADVGSNLMHAAVQLDLNLNYDLRLPKNFSPTNKVSIKQLNCIYNMGDLFLTTHLGEGHGCSITEAMAAGTPVICPRNTNMEDFFGVESERGYLYECKDTIYTDLSGYRKKGLISDIVEQMIQAYKDGKENNPKTVAAREWCLKNTWDHISNQWIKLFNQYEHKRLVSIVPSITMGEDL